MYYQLITSEPFQSTLFAKLSEAKRFVLKYYPNVHCVIRHRSNERTTRITSYYPSFGFETETIKEIYKRFCHSLE